MTTSMARKVTVAIAIMALVLPGAIVINELPAASAASYGPVTVKGTKILVNGQAPTEKFFGVVDTTALAYAILAYIEGQTQYAGKSSVFLGPDTSSYAPVTPSATAAQFFDSYFALLSYYGCNLVRLGPGDSWGTGIQYDAWVNHHDAFASLLRSMTSAAEAHGVWICLVMAGAAEYPTYAFGGTGTVFDTGSTAYRNYIAYSKGVMALLDGEDGVFCYDLFNEPDHNNCYTGYWSSKGGKTAFSTWSSAVAAATASVSAHPRTMGVAGLGYLFGWGKADFDLCTGKVPFEIASRHYYASATGSSNTYLFSDPEAWADADGKPLFWSELAYNGVYPLVRYTFGEQSIWSAGGQAITSMVLTGTAGYPYTGGSRPVASFTVTPSQGSSGTTFAVDASSSSDAQDTSAKLQVRWDWESDGAFDTARSSTKTATHAYGQDGTYTITLEVTDTSGLSSTATRTVTVGGSAPTIAISSPASGSVLRSTSVTATWSCSASAGISTLSIQRDGGTWTSLSATATSYGLSSLAQGKHTVIVKCVDKGGRSAAATTTFTVDTVAPTLAVTSPTGGGYVTSASPVVRWSASDASAGISYFLVKSDGGAWTRVSATATSYTFGGLSQGSHTFTVRAVDKVGNYGDVSRTFTVDSVTPALKVTAPASGAVLTSTSATVKWTGSDGTSGIAAYYIKRDTGAWTTLSSSTLSYTYAGLSHASHTVTVRAVDKAGNLRDVAVTFSVK